MLKIGSILFLMKIIRSEYVFLKDYNVYTQLAGQVYYTNQYIEKTLLKIPKPNRLVVSFEAFCRNPSKLYEQVMRKLNQLGYQGGKTYMGPRSFQPTGKEYPDFEFDVKAAKTALSNIKNRIEHEIA